MKAAGAKRILMQATFHAAVPDGALSWCVLSSGGGAEATIPQSNRGAVHSQGGRSNVGECLECLVCSVISLRDANIANGGLATSQRSEK